MCYFLIFSYVLFSYILLYFPIFSYIFLYFPIFLYIFLYFLGPLRADGGTLPSAVYLQQADSCAWTEWPRLSRVCFAGWRRPLSPNRSRRTPLLLPRLTLDWSQSSALVNQVPIETMYIYIYIYIHTCTYTY